jgi:hypothetical protein
VNVVIIDARRRKKEINKEISQAKNGEMISDDELETTSKERLL